MRAFNRFYTNVIGLLRGKYLDTPYSLTEARLLFELGQRDASEVADLRRVVDIDAGYLSRILGRFDDDGLISRQRSPADGRRQVIALTGAGRAAIAGLDAGSARQTRDMLAHVRATRTGAGCSRPCASSPTLSRSPRDRAATCCGLPARATWAGSCSGTRRCTRRSSAGTPPTRRWWPGSSRTTSTTGTRRPRRPGSPRWTARRPGCVFCVRENATIARLRLLLVEPWARGLGIGARLVEEVLTFARGAGYSAITLWTNDVLADARRIYERAGFTLDDETPHHSFGQDLVGQNWSRALLPGVLELTY